jgi:hypothetical protein
MAGGGGAGRARHGMRQVRPCPSPYVPDRARPIHPGTQSGVKLAAPWPESLLPASTGSFVAVVAFVTAGVVLASGFRYLTSRKQSQHQLTSGEQYRALADEYRRLSDLAITAQEHTDLKMGEISAQLDFLRTQNDSLQKILRDVE